MNTRTSYTKQLDKLDGHVAALGRAAADNIRATGEAIYRGDMEKASEVVDGYATSERLRRSVEDSCMSLMLLQQPLARDLRLVTASFRAISDISRIEEMSYQIALFVQELPKICEGPLSNELGQLSDHAATMVDEAIDAFKHSDVETAENVFTIDDSVDKLYDVAREEVVKMLKEDDTSAFAAPELLTIAKYYERMGDHAQSIADWAIFRATGAYRGRAMGEKE